MGTGGAGRGDPQGRIEREEFARGRLVAGEPPVEPRAAATTVVARRNPRGSFDVLLLERPAASSFAAGAFVFPGGVVDEEDAEPFWADRLPEVSPEDAAGLVAGLRELFEETGLLLSDGPGGWPGCDSDCSRTTAPSGGWRKNSTSAFTGSMPGTSRGGSRRRPSGAGTTRGSFCSCRTILFRR